MQNLGLKVKIIPSDQVYIGNNFDNLYFHAKSKVKGKISDISLKIYDHKWHIFKIAPLQKKLK